MVQALPRFRRELVFEGARPLIFAAAALTVAAELRPSPGELQPTHTLLHAPSQHETQVATGREGGNRWRGW